MFYNAFKLLLIVENYFWEFLEVKQKLLILHSNFHLIATQNQLSGRFSQKRQFLSQKFRSRFQTITFVDIQKDELFEIATGLAKDLNISDDIIQKLIDFHFLWKEKEIKENQIHVFTIREISGTIKSMKEGLSPFESILIHYGSRCHNQKLEHMKQIRISLGFIPTYSGLFLPPINQKLFMTQPLMLSILNSLHLFQTCHPILITGHDGCGKTAFAHWMAEIYQIRQLPKENRDNKEETEDTIETENKNENDDNGNNEN